MTTKEHTQSAGWPTIRDLLARGATSLRTAGIETPELDASVLLGHFLGVNRAALYARALDLAPPDIDEAFGEAIARRMGGVPVAYITGTKEFLGLSFAVTTATLVPRPETELLVMWAITWLGVRRGTAKRVVDIGTGSGAIGVSLAHITGRVVIASDVSLAALRVARENASANGVRDRVRFVCGNLLSWLGVPVDLVLANLPYLTDVQADDPGLASEPRSALAGGDADGFALYRALIPQVATRLLPGGAFAFEIDPAQAAVARSLCESAIPGARTTIHRDLAGLDRFVTVETAP